MGGWMSQAGSAGGWWAGPVRSVGSLFGVGAGLLLVATVLPLWPQADRSVLVTIGVVGLGSAAGLVAVPVAEGRRRVVAGLVVLFGIVLVSVAAWAMGPAGAPAAGAFYVYASGHAFYYLPRRWAVGQVVAIGLGYGLALWQLDAVAGLAQWVLVVGAATTAGVVIAGVARGRLADQRTHSEQLAELDRARTTFLRTVAHDLRGPLTTITGMTATLADRADQLSAEQVEQLTRRVRVNADRMEQMVEDLLALERLRDGRLQLQLADCDLVPLVEQVAAQSPEGSEVTVDVPARAPVVADRACLEHALRNLVDNAVTHSPEDTPVEVSLQARRDGWRLSVADRGPGIPDEAKPGIFDPFTRTAATRDSKGHGLGLSIAADLVELHGGTITVDDRPGGGSRFTVDLPARPDRNSRAGR